MEKKSRIMWIEALRITACFAVVLLHINVRWLYSVPIHTLEWHVLDFWISVMRLDKGGVLKNLSLWPVVPLLGLLIFIGSWLVVQSLKKIPYVGNWIV